MNKKKIKSYGYLSVGIEKPVVKRIRSQLPKGTSINTLMKFMMLYHSEIFEHINKLSIETLHNIKYMPIGVLQEEIKK